MEGSTAATTAKQKPKLKGNKKEEKEKNPKGKVAKGKGKELMLNYAKFEGQGLSYKAKLFGFVEVPGPRGDQSSVQAIQKLKQQAKQMKKGANEHKLKITFNITLQGVRLFNEKTQTIEHEHPIQKISFISHDPEDRHVFGYIYSPPRSAANEARKYYLFAIKSDKSADVITAQLYELFQVAYKMQENRKSRGKDNTAGVKQKQQKSSQPLEPLQDKMLLEMSNKIGGDQQSYPPDEHLYAEPTFDKRTPSEPAPPEYAIPSDQPVQASSDNESNEYQIPRQQNEINEMENKDLTSGFTLPLNTNDFDSNMQGSDQPFSDNASTPTTNDDFKFEADFESFPTEENSNQNTFHAEFPAFDNGFTSSEKVKSPDGFPESPVDSEKINTPDSNEIHGSPFSDQISFNAFGDLPSNVKVKTDLETSQNETANIDNDVSTSSEPETEDVNSTKFENQPAEGDIKEIPLANPTIGDFQSERQNNSDAMVIETETSTTTETNIFVTQSSFEINFETENEDDKAFKQRQHDTFSFDSGSDTFPGQGAFASTGQTDFEHSAFPEDDSSQDPFASTGQTEFEQSAFTDDDPFSPKGGSNRDTKSDPFAENDDLFTAGFSDVNINGFEQPKEDISDEANSGNDQYFDSSNKEEDIFEAIFEAKMEGQFEDETLNEDENENEALNNIEQNQVEFNLETSRADDTNTEHDRQEKEFIETLEENKNVMALSNKETIEPVEVQLFSDSLVPNNETSEEQPENEETRSSENENVNEVNTFDFSSNDVYVTLKTAAPPNDIPLSPTEFSPPPLPPRSAPSIPKEPLNTIASPKIPPALPPRPSYQPSHAEATVRKPPELPPRLDLEENDLVETQLVDSELETNSELFPNDTESPMFQASFDTFDFDSIENNSDSPVGNVGSPAAGFASSDPFKDPFAGADPFQTPIAGDPFASSNVQPDNDDFDPFSGDDPFAMTPAFDAQLSFGSPGNPHLSASDEPNIDEVKDKFADFSTAFT